jgi:membrane protein implicated in regulation of membrane protease activity
MEKITRSAVAVALRLLSVALLLGAVAFGCYLIVDLASVSGLGNVSWEGAVMLFLFFSVVPAFAAMAVWKTANRVRRAGQGSIE